MCALFGAQKINIKIPYRALNLSSHFNRIHHLFSGRQKLLFSLVTTTTDGVERLTGFNLLYIDWIKSHEKNISTQCPETQTHPRLPLTHGYQSWPSRAQPSPCQRPQASVCITRYCPEWAVLPIITDASFCRAKRLLNAQDYTTVFDRTQAKAFHNSLLLLGRKNGGSTHRLGLVIAKKNVRLAVQRNRIKRLAREFVRKVPDNSTPMDVVLLSRRGLDQLDNAQIAALLQKQWTKLAAKLANTEPVSNQDSQCAEL